MKKFREKETTNIVRITIVTMKLRKLQDNTFLS